MEAEVKKEEFERIAAKRNPTREDYAKLVSHPDPAVAAWYRAEAAEECDPPLNLEELLSARAGDISQRPGEGVDEFRDRMETQMRGGARENWSVWQWIAFLVLLASSAALVWSFVG